MQSSHIKVFFVGIPDPENGSKNPGGDWNPGWGVDLRYIYLNIYIYTHQLFIETNQLEVDWTLFISRVGSRGCALQCKTMIGVD